MGGRGLLWTLGLFCCFLLVGTVWAEDGSSAAVVTPAAPPKAKIEVVEDTFSGHKIPDSYRWLEDADSPATREYVQQELAYTRGVLDPLPERGPIHRELTELLSIGIIGTPQVGGNYY